MSHMTFFIIVFGVVFFIAFGLLFLMLGRVMWEDYRDYRAKRNKAKLDHSAHNTASNRG